VSEKIIVKIPKSFMVATSKLKSNPINIKHHPPDQIHDLVELIKIVGFKDPIVIDKNFVIWAGHGRLEAALFLQMEEIPCIWLEGLNEQQKKIFMLMDNKVNESPWNRENLAIVFQEVDPIYFKPFEMKFEESLKGLFESKDAETIGELDTENQCPQCGYKW